MIDENLPKIVLKFGGTSVGNGERLIHVAEVVKNSAEKCKPIIVLSAMSGETKKLGTTSRLLEAINDILIPSSLKYIEIVDSIEKSHLAAARIALEGHQELLAEIEKGVSTECTKLRSFMTALELIDEISPKSKDVIVSAGEKLAARILSVVLRSKGLNAKYISLDSLIDKHFEPDNLDQSFYDYLTMRLKEVLLQDSKDYVCVLTGFFGPCPGSLLESIGRGYTDLTAALVAVGLSASELQVWKEVDGIFSADPRKVPNARKLDRITPQEAAELTYYGSEVIHPFTMEQVMRSNIPIRIKNTFAPDGTGTLITPVSGTPAGNSHRRPTAVTIKDNIAVLNIHSNRKSVSHGFLAKIFLILDKNQIVSDLIATSEVHVSIALGSSVNDSRFEKAIPELRKIATVEIADNQAILSLVGKHMKQFIGISATLFGVLAASGVNIEMLSQGASEINISCVIKESDAIKALNAVHDEIVCKGLLKKPEKESVAIKDLIL